MNNNVNIEKLRSLNEICTSASDLFKEISNGSFCSVIVPGGNTPIQFYNLLSHKDIDWSKITLILSDERLVSIDDKHSNYGMIKANMIKNLPVDNRPNILPEMEKLDIQRIDEFLKRTNSTMSNIPKIEQAFLGLGSDGHTASVFPGKKAISKEVNPFYLTNKDGERFKRITLSLSFLKTIPILNFLIAGISKKNILEIIIKHQEENKRLPCIQLIHNTQVRINILCDIAAWPKSNNA